MVGCFVAILICFALCCFFGQLVNNRFEEINDAIFLCSWEDMPHKMQKLLPTMMMITQEPVYIHGDMHVLCTHELFKQVLSVNFFKIYYPN